MALLVPAVIIVVIAFTVWPDERASLPASLCLPGWFDKLSRVFPNDVIAISSDDRRPAVKDAGGVAESAGGNK